MKYMIKDEWSLLNENFEGISYQNILEYYDDIHNFATKFCQIAKLPQSCISTAMIFFHKYFVFVKGFKDNFEKYFSILVCIFISIKVCNYLMSLRQIIPVFFKLYNKKIIDEKELFEYSEMVCEREFHILSYIGFDLNVDLPYIYISEMKFYYLEYLQNSKYLIMTTNFINDSFKLPLCLYYDPLLIALACVYLLSYYFKINLPDTIEGVKWYHIIDKQIKFEDIEEISVKIIKIYDFARNKGQEKEIINETPMIVFKPTDDCIIDWTNKSKDIGPCNTELN